MIADLGLGPEFMLPISHQIRERILELQKLAHNDRRLKQNNALELDFHDKAEGCYAQTRGQVNFDSGAHAAQKGMGLPIEMFRDSNGLEL